MWGFDYQKYRKVLKDSDHAGHWSSNVPEVLHLKLGQENILRFCIFLSQTTATWCCTVCDIEIVITSALLHGVSIFTCDILLCSITNIGEGRKKKPCTSLYALWKLIFKTSYCSSDASQLSYNFYATFWIPNYDINYHCRSYTTGTCQTDLLEDDYSWSMLWQSAVIKVVFVPELKSVVCIFVHVVVSSMHVLNSKFSLAK